MTRTAFTWGRPTFPWTLRAGYSLADKLIGRSNNSDAEVEESVAMGVDYVAVGATFPTTTVGKGARAAIGLDGIRRARELTTLPLVAIGGIKESNVADVVRSREPTAWPSSAPSRWPMTLKQQRDDWSTRLKPQGADPEHHT